MFTRHLFRLRFTRPARFSHYLHGGVVHGLLGHAVRDRQLPTGLIPSVPESGRALYDSGDPYHLGITLVGEARGALGAIERGLRRIGGLRHVPPGISLGGNFELEAVETMPPVEIGAETAALAEGGISRIHFVSPLRLKRPIELTRPGASFLDPRCFPLPHFLDRLWRRLFLLYHGHWPTNENLRVSRPTLPEEGEVDSTGLYWMDLPNPARRRTLGGVLGQVECRCMPEDWLPILVLGRYLQAGASTHFGFGRFVIGDDLGSFERPAHGLIAEGANRKPFRAIAA